MTSPRMPPYTPAAESTGPIVSSTQIVSRHTAQGVQLDQYLGDDLIDLTWSRDSRQVSKCTINVTSPIVDGNLPDVMPGVQWLSVWDDTAQELYWTGPIQRVTADPQQMTIVAADMAALFTRTRCPLTKQWNITDPADIAVEMIDALIALHNLNTRPVSRRDPFGDKYDYSATADAVMFDSVMNDLVNFGLEWTVVSGTPVLGPLPRTAVVAGLNENDFVGGGLAVVRDGTNSFNDILLRSGTDESRARTPMGGLNYQTIYHADTVSGVSNTDRATKQAACYVSKIHDSISLPDSAVLHPDAPVRIDQLIPSARFVIDAYGLLIPMELTGIDVSYSQGTSSVSVRMAGVDDDLPELITLQRKSSISGLQQ